MKESKAELKNWSHIPCSWIGRLNIVEYISSSQLDMSQCNPNKNLSKLVWGYQQTDLEAKTQNSQHNMKNKITGTGGSHL
jgi:hypothetical protein